MMKLQLQLMPCCTVNVKAGSFLIRGCLSGQVPDLLQLRDLLAQTTQDLFDVLEDAHPSPASLPFDSNPGAIVLQARPSIGSFPV